MIKKKVINILLGLSVLLLVVNLVVEQLNKKEPVVVKPGITVNQVEDKLYKTLNLYGILPEWIKIFNKNFQEQDSLNHYFRINIPPDLPQPSFLYDLRKMVPDSLDIVTDELDKHGDSVVKVYNKDQQLLHIVLKYTDDIKRDYCKFSFLVETEDEFDEELLNTIVNNPYAFSLLLRPSFTSYEIINQIEGLDKDYSILIDDEENDKLFQLSGISDQSKLKKAIREIVGHFKNSAYYLIDDKSSIYLSTAINFIRDEFRNEGVKLNKLSDVIVLEEKTPDEIVSLLKFYSSSATSENHYYFRIYLDDFLALKNDITVFKKKGHPIVLAANSLD